MCVFIKDVREHAAAVGTSYTLTGFGGFCTPDTALTRSILRFGPINTTPDTPTTATSPNIFGLALIHGSRYFLCGGYSLVCFKYLGVR